MSRDRNSADGTSVREACRTRSCVRWSCAVPIGSRRSRSRPSPLPSSRHPGATRRSFTLDGRVALALADYAMWRSYYLFWFVVPAVLAAISEHPSILVVVLIALVARRWIPDPYLFFKHASRVNALKTQIKLNAANSHARTQLAEIWLSKRRPRRAVPLLEQALERDRDSAELRYLLGLARVRAGLAAAAIEPLTEAVTREPKLRYGHAWLALGDAYFAVGRIDDAVDAFQRASKINSSSLEIYTKLAHALEKKPDLAAAKRVRHEALETYRVLPAYQRRNQLGWWLRAKLAL